MTKIITRYNVIGCGRVGSCIAAILKSKGHTVHLFDKDPKAVDRLVRGLHQERGLADHIRTSVGEFKPGDLADVSAMVAQATFIVVNTPSKPDGSFDASNVKSALDASSKSRCGLRVVVSTLSPGSLENMKVDESWASGATGRVVYAPTMIALGTVIDNLKYPTYQIAGFPRSAVGNDREDMKEVFWKVMGEIIARPAHELTKIELTYTEAEWAKILVNGYLTTKISFANAAATAMRSNDKSIDVNKVLAAVGEDKRVGHLFFSQGGSYGGPCLPRDTRAVAVAAGYTGLNDGLRMMMDTNDAVNDFRVQDIVQRAIEAWEHRSLDPELPIIVIGLTYKPGVVDSTDTPSFGRSVLDALQSWSFEVKDKQSTVADILHFNSVRDYLNAMFEKPELADAVHVLCHRPDADEAHYFASHDPGVVNPFISSRSSLRCS